MNGEQPIPTMALVRTMQIIWFALLAGVSTFAAFAIYAHPADPAKEPMLSYVSIAFAAMSIVMSFVVPGIMCGAAVKSIGAGLKNADQEMEHWSFAGVYQTQLIVGMAILEGSAFFCLTAYQIEGIWWTLAIAGVLGFLMLVRFPGAGRVESWCRSQHEITSMSGSNR